jgi:hypothetical protein
MTTVQLQTHRFLFTDEVSEILFDFARVHQYDERKTYKEAWQTLLKDEDTYAILMNEINIIKQNGYTGDVLDKMFKSTRYYYRKKLIKEASEEKGMSKGTSKGTRKEYESMPSFILEEIDKHIKQEIALQMSPLSQNIDNTNQILVSRARPAKSFEKYYIEYKNKELTSNNEYFDKEKLKKTYKNRFYKIRVKLIE